jgi:DNA-binding NtrC family response regulator
MADILVVDDDQAIARAFERFLKFDRHTFRIASSAEEGLHLLAERAPDLVFLDVRMPGLDGLDALPRMREAFPAVDVVIMTAHGTSQTSIDAMRAGAFDLLAKPLDVDQLRAIIAKVAAAQLVRAKVGVAADAGNENAALLVGESPAMRDVFKLIGRLATLDVPALVVGERGTGKRLVVGTIHANSARSGDPLTLVDCHAPDVSTELDAALRPTSRGTVHLSGIDGLPARDQARLNVALRARFPSEGARVIASTATNLIELSTAGEFDRELAETLGVITLTLPPLRERRDDLPRLVDVLLQRLSREVGRSIQGVEPEVERMFREHTWPGNIAELANVLRRAAILSATGVIGVDDLGDALSARRTSARRGTDTALGKAAKDALRDRMTPAPGNNTDSLFHDVVAVVEEALVQEALDITSGNQVKAAEMLGVNRTTLRKKARLGE